MATRKPLVNAGGFPEELPVGDILETDVELKNSIQDLYNKIDTTNNGKKSLLIYYGFPIAYNGIWTTEGVIGEISKFDYFVCGDTYQQPTHVEFASTSTIVNGVRALGTKVYGYVPIGVNTENRPMANLKTAVDQWIALGVDGIFLDEFGFDYGNTRQRQIDVVNFIHSKGLPICANAWVIEEFVCDTLAETGWASGDWKYTRWQTCNPTDLPSPKMPGDFYMFENFCYSHLGPTAVWDTQERAQVASALAKAKNVNIWALAVFGETTPGVVDPTKLGSLGTLDKAGDYITANAYLYDFNIVGSGGFSFGSNGTPLWAPLKQLPSSAKTPTALAQNDYTAMTGTRFFGPVKIVVTNTASVQSVVVTDSTPIPLGQETGGTSSENNIITSLDSTASLAGTVKLFRKPLANRQMPAFVDPMGYDAVIQPMLSRNKVGLWLPHGNGTAVPGIFGIGAMTVVGTATTRNVATTNMFTRTRRLGIVTAATAGALANIRLPSAQCTLGNPANGLGGFFISIRFGISDPAAPTTGYRTFVGIRNTITAATNVEPSTIPNCIGIGHGAADSNLFLYSGGSAAQTPINLGANFPVLTTNVDFYDLILYSPPTESVVYWQVDRLNTGDTASGALNGTIGTQLPLLTTLLTPINAFRTNNASAVAVGIDFVHVYFETDY